MCCNGDDWESKGEESLDLELENQALELDLALKRGMDFEEEVTDQKLHNAFLKNVEAFEDLDEQPKRSMRSLFPDDCTFPPADRMSKKELTAKLAYITEIFSQNNVQIALVGKLPDGLLYTYLTTEVILNELTFPSHNSGFNSVIDGCDGYCPECFQKDFCETKDEIGWDEDGTVQSSDDDAGGC